MGLQLNENVYLGNFSLNSKTACPKLFIFRLYPTEEVL